jgi:hypothetical protein
VATDLPGDTAALSALAWLAGRIEIGGEGFVGQVVHKILKLFDGLPVVPIDPIRFVERLVGIRVAGWDFLRLVLFALHGFPLLAGSSAAVSEKRTRMRSNLYGKTVRMFGFGRNGN